MKIYLLLVYISLSLNLYTQPKLNKIQLVRELPKLTLSDLNKDFKSIRNKEGVIVYSTENNTWKLYQYLKGYEKYGKIKNIVKERKSFCVCFEKGTLLSKRHKVKILDYEVHTVQFIDNQMVCIATDVEKDKAYYSASALLYTLSKKQYYLLKINLKNQKTEIIPLNKELRGIVIESTIFQNKLLVLFLIKGIDSGSSILYSINQKGIVSEFMRRSGYSNIIYSAKAFNNKLNILTTDTIFIRVGDSIIGSVPVTPKIRNIWQPYILINNKLLTFPQMSFDVYKIDSLIINEEESVAPSFFYEYQSLLFIEEDFYSILGDYLVKYSGDGLKEREFFYIRNNYIKRPRYCVEDSSEIWLFSQREGISRFNKQDSVWHTYTDYLKYFNNSHQWLVPYDITLNEDYVFIYLENLGRGENEFLIFDRKKEFFSVLSKQEFLNKFLPIDGGLCNYKGDILVKKEDISIASQVIKKSLKWKAFLFFYSLPKNGNMFVQQPKYNILYGFYQGGVKGFLLYDKIKKTIEFRSKKITLLDDKRSPNSSIYGKKDDLWQAAGGTIMNFSFGDDIFINKDEWKDKFYRPKLVYFDDYIYLEREYNYRYFMNKNTFEITDINTLYPGLPKPSDGINYYKTDHYFYILTQDEIVYFDHSFKLKGIIQGKFNLYKSFKTNQNLYLNDGKDFYILTEE